VTTLTRGVRTIVLLGAALVVMACGTTPTLGVLLPMTGAASSYGESMRHGTELALAEAEAEGALPAGLVVEWADSKTDPEAAVAAFRSLASDAGAKLVICGTTSDSAKALLPVMDQLNTICLSPSATAPMLTKESRLFFRVFPSDELEGQRAGRFLREDQDRSTVLIFAEDTEQARGIEPPFRQVFEQAMGGKVVGRVVLNGGDWRREAADIVSAEQPEAVYVIAYAEKALEVLRHLREQNFSGTLLAASSFYSGPFIEEHPEEFEGVFVPLPAFDTQDESNPLVKSFVESYRETYDDEPDIYAAHAYDAMRVALEVFRRTKAHNVTELRRALQFGIKEFPGVTGIIQFTEYGDVHHNPIMFTIRDGQVLNYERFIEEEKSRIRERIRDLLQK